MRITIETCISILIVSLIFSDVSYSQVTECQPFTDGKCPFAELRSLLGHLVGLQSSDGRLISTFEKERKIDDMLDIIHRSLSSSNQQQKLTPMKKFFFWPFRPWRPWGRPWWRPWWRPSQPTTPQPAWQFGAGVGAGVFLGWGPDGPVFSGDIGAGLHHSVHTPPPDYFATTGQMTATTQYPVPPFEFSQMTLGPAATRPPIDAPSGVGWEDNQPDHVVGVEEHTYPGVTQSNWPGVTQGNGPGVTQGNWPGVTQGNWPGVTQGNWPGITQSNWPGVTQGDWPGVTQGNWPGVTQGNWPGVTQGNWPGVTQGNWPGVTQGLWPGSSTGGWPGGSTNGWPGGSTNGWPGGSTNGWPTQASWPSDPTQGSWQGDLNSGGWQGNPNNWQGDSQSRWKPPNHNNYHWRLNPVYGGSNNWWKDSTGSKFSWITYPGTSAGWNHGSGNWYDDSRLRDNWNGDVRLSDNWNHDFGANEKWFDQPAYSGSWRTSSMGFDALHHNGDEKDEFYLDPQREQHEFYWNQDKAILPRLAKKMTATIRETTEPVNERPESKLRVGKVREERWEDGETYEEIVSKK